MHPNSCNPALPLVHEYRHSRLLPLPLSPLCFPLPTLALLPTSLTLYIRWAECGTLGELSPAAVKQLQAACTQAMTQSYADGVDALVFVPPKQGPDATPEELAAAQAAAEAAAKIQANKLVSACGVCCMLMRACMRVCLCVSYATVLRVCALTQPGWNQVAVLVDCEQGISVCSAGVCLYSKA